MWKIDIVPDIDLVNEGKLTQQEFLNKHWTKFKPVYINFHGYCDDGDLYLLLSSFWGKIFKADVQPVFKSDNQIFSYFKTAVRNKHYDITHKKEISLVTFTDYDDYADSDFGNSSKDTFEDRIPDESRPIDEVVGEKLSIRTILDELSERLSEPYVAVLTLMYRNNYTAAELRKELGVSISTVRDRLGIIRTEAKNIIKELEIEENNFKKDK